MTNKSDGVDLALGALDEVPGMPLSTRAVGRSLRRPRCFEGCVGHATNRKLRLSDQVATRRSSFETEVSHRRTCHRSCARHGREGCSRDVHVIHGPTGSEAGSANGIADRHLIPRGKVPAVCWSATFLFSFRQFCISTSPAFHLQSILERHSSTHRLIPMECRVEASSRFPQTHHRCKDLSGSHR